jgi:uncharacterized protein
MKKILLFIAMMATALAVFSQIEEAIPPVPSPAKLVNDFTGRALSAADRDKLEQKLVNFDREADVQVAIIIMDSTFGYPSDEYAKALGNKWGVGNQVKNNGIVILITTGGGEGKRGLTIQLGKSYAAYPVDDVLKEIVSEMIPFFKEGKMYEGLDKGTDLIIEAIERLNQMTGSAFKYEYSTELKNAG